MAQTTTFVAFLRGVNVGGKALVNMAELAACCRLAGLQQVRTYIASGNLIFKAAATIDPRQLETTIEHAVQQQFGMPITVVVRSLADIRTLLDSVPASWQHPSDLKCNVIFLRHEIDDPSILTKLAPKPGIEELDYHPGTLLWSARTSNIPKSAMAKLSSNPLYKQMTARIITTVRKVYALMLATDAA